MDTPAPQLSRHRDECGPRLMSKQTASCRPCWARARAVQCMTLSFRSLVSLELILCWCCTTGREGGEKEKRGRRVKVREEIRDIPRLHCCAVHGLASGHQAQRVPRRTHHTYQPGARLMLEQHRIQFFCPGVFCTVAAPATADATQ